MGTIRIFGKEAIDGDIIAEDLFADEANIALIMKGTVVNQRVKDKLVKSDIGKILVDRAGVEDEKIEEPAVEKKKDSSDKHHSEKKIEFKDEYRAKVSDVKDIFKGVLDGEKIDLEKVSNVSDEVFKSVDEIYIAIESISELKDFDDYTYIHSVNVALYSMLLAKWLELDKESIKDLVRASVLHDIGKAKIPDGILNKPGELTDEEFMQMRNHPKYGYDLCKSMYDIGDEVKDAILHHHEKEDGTGYPNGLKGDEISLFSKIIAVCDVYDAITSKRVYKDKITPFETFDEMMKHGYNKLDTKIMLTFLNNISSLYVGLKVRLNTGEIGEIIFIPTDKLSQPLVKVGEKFIDFSQEHSYKIQEIV